MHICPTTGGTLAELERETDILALADGEILADIDADGLSDGDSDGLSL